MILEFWDKYKDYDLHPDDKLFINYSKLIDYDYNKIIDQFGEDLKSNIINDKFKNLVNTHHIVYRLFSIPFFGDIENGKVFILYGNPGFHTGDFIDEYKNEKFIQILKKNLKNEIRTFFFADEISKTTGGYGYWKYEIDKIIYSFQQKSKTKEEEAREYVLKNLVMIESLPYHSYESPFQTKKLEQIPSSKMNKKYVHDVLLEKVRQNKIMLFAWRKVNFWSLPEHKNILSRKNARLRFFQEEEIEKIANFLLNA